MRIIFFAIILGLIAMIPFGVWVSIGLFSIWLYSKSQSIEDVDSDFIQKHQFDFKILEEMK